MCSKELKKSSITSRRLFKVLLAGSLLALLALQPLQAWPLKSSQTEEKIKTDSSAQSTQLIAQTQQEQLSTLSTTSSSENMNALQDYAMSLKDELVKEVKKLPDSYVDKFDELVKSIELIKSIDEAEDQIASSTVNELKDISAQLTTIKADLAKKEGEYEEVVKTLKKEQSTKLFANVGLVLGFQKSAPVYGANANVGIRLGKSMTLSVGAQYMFGSFANMVFDSNIDRLAFTGSIGWEW